MPDELDCSRLDEIIRALCDRLDGEYVLLGGALTAIWLSPRRVTEDIDLVGLSGTAGERLQLMDAALEIGLPIEIVNSASDFFLARIPGWRSRIEVFRRGPRATIYRPDPTLFLLLKAGRLSEQDLEDCRALIQKAREEGLRIDRPAVLARLESLPYSEDEDLRERRSSLAASLSSE